MLNLASASGNTFAYVWRDEVPANAKGSEWAKSLCSKKDGPRLDGLFFLDRPNPGEPWVMEHWDADGSRSFCSNGTRAAMALPGAATTERIEVISNDELVELTRTWEGVGLRMPCGEAFGLKPAALNDDRPHVYGWIGNPQLIVEVPDVSVLDLPTLAPQLRFHPAFPEGTNVNFVHLDSMGQARIRSWERGVEGETLCCGTGCAVAGAWLALRTGLPRWRFVPMGSEPVVTEADMNPEGYWRSLWLHGPVQWLGYRPSHPELIL